MSYLDTNNNDVVINLSDDVRASFIRKTYIHLAGAILLFAFLEYIFFSIGLGYAALKLITVHKFAWLGVLLVYGFASSFVHRMARNPLSREKQYIALFAGVFLESLIFLPLIAISVLYAPDVLPQAIKITLVLVAALTAVVFVTKKDFSFLRTALTVGGLIALGLIVVSILFGFSLGYLFSGAMIIFASASILYETSNIMHYYSEDDHVAASLSLFASVGLLFWYVIQFLLAFTSNE